MTESTGPGKAVHGKAEPGKAGRLHFLAGFLRRPDKVGTFIPSSRIMVRRILDVGEVESARRIVELGPGTGAVTREILRRMPAQAKLVALETDPNFVTFLRQAHPDPRFEVQHCGAHEIGSTLSDVDLVVSGIPFSCIEPDEARQTLSAIRQVLRPGGLFVAYQLRDHVARFAEPLFGPTRPVIEWRNIPPLRVFVWKQPSSPADSGLLPVGPGSRARVSDASTPAGY